MSLDILFDIVVLAGFVSLAAGLWMISPAICLSVSGALLIAAGIAGAKLWRTKRGNSHRNIQ
jgi:hypothetical protein